MSKAMTSRLIWLAAALGAALGLLGGIGAAQAEEPPPTPDPRIGTAVLTLPAGECIFLAVDHCIPADWEAGGEIEFDVTDDRGQLCWTIRPLDPAAEGNVEFGGCTVIPGWGVTPTVTAIAPPHTVVSGGLASTSDDATATPKAPQTGTAQIAPPADPPRAIPVRFILAVGALLILASVAWVRLDRAYKRR